MHGTVTSKVVKLILIGKEGTMLISLKSCFGIALCACVATALSILLKDSGEIRLTAPVLCLLVVLLTSSYFGRLPGFIGAAVAGLTLDYLLFPPLGSFAIAEPAARTTLILCELSAIGLVLISPSYSNSHSASKTQSRWEVSIGLSHRPEKQRDFQ